MVLNDLQEHSLTAIDSFKHGACFAHNAKAMFKYVNGVKVAKHVVTMCCIP